MARALVLLAALICSGSLNAAELDLLAERLALTCMQNGSEERSEAEIDKACKALALRYDKTLRTLTHARYVQAYASDMEHRSASWYWHQVQTIGVFVLVLLIVICAVIMSFMQVKRGSQSSFEFGQNIKVNSNAIGSVTLILAMGFFYLYVATVYPLTEVSKPKPAAEAHEGD